MGMVMLYPHRKDAFFCRELFRKPCGGIIGMEVVGDYPGSEMKYFPEMFVSLPVKTERFHVLKASDMLACYNTAAHAQRKGVFLVGACGKNRFFE